MRNDVHPSSYNLYDRAVGATPCCRAIMRQLVAVIGPVQVSDRPGAFFIRIGCTVIREKREVAVRSCINTNLCDGLLLMSAFDGGADRNNGAGADEERNGVDGRGDGDGLAARTRSLVQ